MLKGTLLDEVEVVRNLGSGASHSALAMRQLDDCDKAELFIPMQKLRNHFK